MPICFHLWCKFSLWGGKRFVLAHSFFFHLWCRFPSENPSNVGAEEEPSNVEAEEENEFLWWTPHDLTVMNYGSVLNHGSGVTNVCTGGQHGNRHHKTTMTKIAIWYPNITFNVEEVMLSLDLTLNHLPTCFPYASDF